MSGFQNSHVRISILSRAEVLSLKLGEKKNILSVILTDKQHVDGLFAHGNLPHVPKVGSCGWQISSKEKQFYRVWESEGYLE